LSELVEVKAGLGAAVESWADRVVAGEVVVVAKVLG
jgi:hypothetical protein